MDLKLSLTILGKLSDWLNRQLPIKLVFILCLIQGVSHLPYLNRPAMGNHVWRQCNSLAMARNYATEDMNIWYPRIDKCYNTNGVTGPQFTSYEYSLALIYKVFGFSENAHRFLSLALGMLALWGMFFLAKAYSWSNNNAFWSAFALMGIPEFYYHSLNAVPDLLSLVAMLFGWAAWKKYASNGNWRWMIVVVACFALAGATKLMFLMPFFWLSGEVLIERPKKALKWLIYTLGAILSVGLSIAWYKWAEYLTSINGIWEFVHFVRFVDGIGGKIQVFSLHLLRDIPETWVGYGGLLSFIIGILNIIQSRKSDLKYWALFAGVILFYGAMQYQLQFHGYYTLVLSPLFAFIVVKGLNHKKSWTPVLMILILISPVWSWIRMHHNWNFDKNNIPVELISKTAVDKITHNLSQPNRDWIVGPDQSGCVLFYYSRAKGYPWYNLQEPDSIFTKYRRMGAKGLISRDTVASGAVFSRLGWKVRVVGEIGPTRWYRWD